MEIPYANIVNKEEAVLKRRITELQNHLQKLGISELKEKESVPEEPKLLHVEPVAHPLLESLPPIKDDESLQSLLSELRQRKKMVRSMRRKILAKQNLRPAPQQFPSRGEIADGQKEQMEEKKKQKEGEDERKKRWDKVVYKQVLSHAKETNLKEQQRIQRQLQLRKDLDFLCAERRRRLEQERREGIRERKASWKQNEAFLEQLEADILRAQKLKEKLRHEQLDSIEKIRRENVARVVSEKAERARDISYSTRKRAYARKAKDRTLKRMLGARPPNPVPRYL